MMYAIVEFKNNETEMVPLNWIADGTPTAEIHAGLTKPVAFYWPPSRSIQLISKALKTCCLPETHWPTYDSVRIIGIGKDYNDARVKVKQSEDTSDLQTDKEMKKRKIKKSGYGDASDVESSSDEGSPVVKKVKMAKKSAVMKMKSGCSISRWPTPPRNGSRPASLSLPASQYHGSTSSPPTIVSGEEAHGSTSPPLCATQGLPRASRSPSPSRASPASTHGSRSPPLPSSSASHDEPHIRRRLEMQRSPQLSSSGRVASKSSSHGLVEARESVHHRLNESTARLLSSPRNAISTTTNRLLLKILTGLEQLRENQTVQGKLLNLLLKKGSIKAPAVCQLPTEINLPITTQEEAEALEGRMQDNALLNTLSSILADQGGHSLEDLVKRAMKYLMSNELARTYNVTGQFGKRSFQKTQMFVAMSGAMKINSATSHSTQKDLEVELRKWFTNARDRGSGSRKKKTACTIEPATDEN